MELEETEKHKYYIENFCKICKKCAKHCPTNSLPMGEKEIKRNYKHWFVKQESCYAYWRTIGSDCAYCIKVCPFTKPDTFLHRIVRRYIENNYINQQIALFFDNLLYG